MPVTLWCYTILSLALIGIPPTGGFISKWYLAQGALQSDLKIFSWLGPVVLLVSALLTAGYLLPVTMKGFFPGREESVVDDDAENRAAARLNAAEIGAGNESKTVRKEPAPLMLIPLIVLAALALLLGVVPNPLIRFADGIARTVL
jgi:multicomponent Na+:H+ antiporter subunit D